MDIITNSAKCAACHICVLACSYHHANVFSKSLSSIEIFKMEASGQVKITIHQAAGDNQTACDRCEKEALPLCIKWCPVGAISR
jgi:Fe-S-cluster-containing dehydrogenase component